MTAIVAFKPSDLLTFNQVNLDKLTETYGLDFYFTYFARAAEYYFKAVDPCGTTMGYIIGKAEGRDENWHGHVTAVTVAPPFRRLGLGRQFMNIMEAISEDLHNGYFVDLYVRDSNKIATKMYQCLGYVIHKKVIGYYSGKDSEDALDMRKSLKRDVDKKSEKPFGRDIFPYEVLEDF